MKFTISIPDNATADWVMRLRQQLIYLHGEVNSFIVAASSRPLTPEEQRKYWDRTEFGLTEIENGMDAIHHSLEGEEYTYPYPIEAKAPVAPTGEAGKP